MPRALLLVLDSVGCGFAPDAALYGDQGANTLAHILDATPGIRLPALQSLGLGDALSISAGSSVAGSARGVGVMTERSAGKDTTTGHWELAGVILEKPFRTFTSFPKELVDAIERDAGVQFIGNIASSGTTVLELLGPEHMQSGHPILYTSADSVLQIAAHEGIVSLDELYRICKIARRYCDHWDIGRVIARPFVTDPISGEFIRTPNRHDYSLVPPHTVLNALSDSGIPVIGVGKISDIFAGSGITESHPTRSNADGMQTIDSLWVPLTHGLMFANLVDFDMLFGHRRDVAGYAEAVESFDHWLSGFLSTIRPDDLVIITADHGNDPIWKGSDHTRERVPVFLPIGVGCNAEIGVRNSFADVAATLATFFQLSPWPHGKSII
ncbi:MAG: phosphopentomutase [Chthoniobacterales bacterium]